MGVGGSPAAPFFFKFIMNITSLINEIKTDPLNRGYANMTDSQLFQSLSNKDRPKIYLISSNDLLAWSGQNGRYSKIVSGTTVTLGSAALTHSCKSICWAALKLIERDGTKLDLSLSDRAAMLSALVTYNVLAQSDIDSLYAMATKNISRLEEIECESITFEYFTYIRNTNK